MSFISLAISITVIYRVNKAKEKRSFIADPSKRFACSFSVSLNNNNNNNTNINQYNHAIFEIDACS